MVIIKCSLVPRPPLEKTGRVRSLGMRLLKRNVLGCIAKLVTHTVTLGWLIVSCLQVAEPVVKHTVHTLTEVKP